MSVVRVHPQAPKVAVAIFVGLVMVFLLVRSQGASPAESAALAAQVQPRVLKPLPPTTTKGLEVHHPAAVPAGSDGLQMAAAEAENDAGRDPCDSVKCSESVPCEFGFVRKPAAPGINADWDAPSCCPELGCEPLGPSPDIWIAKFITTKGDIDVEFHRDWAPQGVDQVYKMIETGFFETNGGAEEGVTFFRAVKNFVVQFGIHFNPDVQKVWRAHKIPDDPTIDQSNKAGYLTFATAGKGTRTTQLFFNLKANAFLDSKGFPPIAKIVSGLDVLSQLNTEYGESPNQGTIQNKGNKYLRSEFPNLDYITGVTIGSNADIAQIVM